MLHYVYVADPGSGQMIGVVSLADLVFATPEQTLAAVMDPDVLRVGLAAKAEDAARLMAEYNLLALPVVDAGGAMVGIITADDAMQVILPEETGDLRAQRPVLNHDEPAACGARFAGLRGFTGSGGHTRRVHPEHRPM